MKRIFVSAHAKPAKPPFDESKFEPMPEVEINPRDEFYVEETTVN